MTVLYSLAFLQTSDAGLPSRDEHWLMLCIAVIAAAMACQAIVTFVAGMAAMKTMNEFKDLAHDMHSRVTPIMAKTSELVTDLTPKIRTVSENVTQISYKVREKVDEFGETASEINRTVAETNQRTRSQVDHVDRMVAEALTATEEITHTVAHGIRVPMKQIAGLIAGLRIGIETLVKNFTPKNDGRGPNGFDL